MIITSRAMRRISRLGTQRGVPKETALRLGLNDRGVFLCWDFFGPRPSDLELVVRRRPIRMEGLVYMRVSDYALDYSTATRGFFLRPRSGRSARAVERARRRS